MVISSLGFVLIDDFEVSNSLGRYQHHVSKDSNMVPAASITIAIPAPCWSNRGKGKNLNTPRDRKRRLLCSQNLSFPRIMLDLSAEPLCQFNSSRLQPQVVWPIFVARYGDTFELLILVRLWCRNETSRMWYLRPFPQPHVYEPIRAYRSSQSLVIQPSSCSLLRHYVTSLSRHSPEGELTGRLLFFSSNFVRSRFSPRFQRSIARV